MDISRREEDQWAQACSDPETQLAALENGLEDWTRMQRWIRSFGDHPRVLNWLEHNPPPWHWRESREAWAYTEMTFAPGWLFTRSWNHP
jgi:hypothetical protein